VRLGFGKDFTFLLKYDFPSIAVITIAIRLQYDDTTTHSTTTEVIEIAVCVRFDCDATTIRLRSIARLLPFDTIRRVQKNEHVNFPSQSCRSRIAIVI